MRDRDKKSFLTIGQRLKLIRAERGLTQLQLANLCDKIDRSKISDIENGKEDIMLSTLFEICEGLKIPLSDLTIDFQARTDL